MSTEWKMVPVEPTAAMIDAHFEAHAKARAVFADVPDVWRAMLAAAPDAPGEPVDAPAQAVKVKPLEWEERHAEPTRAVQGSDEFRCFICAEPIKTGEICATDINEGTCHAACLHGSPAVDLETGEETGGELMTFRYGDDSIFETWIAESWRPMKTAPRDGREVLIKTRSGVLSCTWDESDQSWGAGWLGVGLLHGDDTGWLPLPPETGDTSKRVGGSKSVPLTSEKEG